MSNTSPAKPKPPTKQNYVLRISAEHEDFDRFSHLPPEQLGPWSMMDRQLWYAEILLSQVAWLHGDQKDIKKAFIQSVFENLFFDTERGCWNTQRDLRIVSFDNLPEIDSTICIEHRVYHIAFYKHDKHFFQRYPERF